MSNFNIVRFMGQAIELESPWKISSGIKPDTNHATCSYISFRSITLGQPGSVTFSFGGESSNDITLANITCIDAEPVAYGIDAGTGINGAVKYRLVLIDSRYAFVEPRGGRLCVGIVNPSTNIPPDADRTHVPMTRTMSQCISACLAGMGISASVPAISANAPQDLKWFGTHAPTELEKLLELSDCIFNLQANGSFTIDQRGTGSDPIIGQPFPVAQLVGADARGNTVVFPSYPTQIVNAFQETDLSLPADLSFVGRNSSSGAWQQIDNCGVYTSSAITEMNAHFPNTPSPQNQSACYRFLRLNPDKFDPMNSPILRKTYAQGGADPSDPNGLPPQIDLVVKATVAVQDPSTKLWKMDGMQAIPVDRVLDGNVLSLHHRLVKLNLSGGATTTNDLEGNCLPINLASDIQLQLACGSASWNSTDSLFEPEYFYTGFTGTAESPAQMSSSAAGDALTEPSTLTIPIAELVAVRYGLTVGSDPINLSQLQSQMQAVAPRYLADPSKPARILAGVGFVPFTFDGTLGAVEIDQKKVLTRFHMDAYFRPSHKLVREEFHRRRHPKESHPHEAKTAGSRQAQGRAASSQPVQAMSNYVPPPAPPDAQLFKVLDLPLEIDAVVPPYVTAVPYSNGSAGTMQISIGVCVPHAVGDYLYASEPSGGCEPAGVVLKDAAAKVVAWQETGSFGVGIRCPVEQYGGSNGSIGSPATYTYSPKDPLGLATLAIGLTVQAARSIPLPVTAASHGMVALDNQSGTWILLSVEEVYLVVDC